MNVIQPLDLETSYRTFQFKGDHYLVLTSKLYFPLLGGHPIIFSEAYDRLSSLQVPFIDEGLPKVTPEYMLIADAQTPDEKPLTSLAVEIEVGDSKKSILAIGDRYWVGGITGASKPAEFTSMPLSWSHAFGGDGFDLNPFGLGIHKQASPLGEDLVKLPNIEHPNALMTSLSNRHKPHGCAALAADHPDRLKHMGTYDDAWLKNDYPGYPKDFNFNAFNCAPEDQRLQSSQAKSYAYRISGCHHEHSVIHGMTPDFHIDTRLVKKGKEWADLVEADLIEVRNTLDTIVFFPNQLMGMLVYRATIKIDSMDGSEYQYLLNSYKDDNTARTSKDLLNSLVGRLHPELSMRYALTTRDLIPSSVPCGMARLTGQDTPSENLMAQHIAEKTEALKNEKTAEVEQSLLSLIEQQKAQGLDTSMLERQLQDLHNPIKDEWQLKFEAISQRLAPIDETTGQLDLMKLDFTAFDDLSKLSEEYAQFQLDQTKQQINDQIQQAMQSGNEDLVKALDGVLDKMDAPPMLPRPADPEQTLNQIFGTAGEHDLDKDVIKHQLEAAYEAQVEGYRMGAHMMDMGTPPLKDQQAQRLQWALDKIENGESLKFADLAGLDFSNMDLRNVDFSYCYLEQCQFRHCDLTGANFSHCIAPRCDFTYATMLNCDFTKANIGASLFHHATISAVQSESVEIAKSDFSYAQISNLNLEDTLNLLDITFYQSVFHQVRFGSSTFLETNFEQAVFKQCLFDQATFQSCNLSSIQVSDSTVSGCNIIDSQVTNSQWWKVDATNIRFVSDCKLNGSQFYDCILVNATLRNIEILDTEFLSCTMNNVDLSESNLTNSTLNGCTIKDALLISTIFEHGNLSNCNFMASNFMQAKLANANLSRSNFYGAEFLGAYVHRTDFSGSLMDATKLEDWRPSKWQ